MGLSPAIPAAQVTAWETSSPLPPLGLRCPLLSGAHRLPLALPAEPLPALADRVLSFQAILPNRPLDPRLSGSAGHRTSAGRQKSTPEGGHHGCPVGEDPGGVRL